MAVPKCKVSKARRNTRNSANFKASVPTLVECSSCGEKTMPHKVCPACGSYKGRTVIETKKADKA